MLWHIVKGCNVPLRTIQFTKEISFLKRNKIFYMYINCVCIWTCIFYTWKCSGFGIYLEKQKNKHYKTKNVKFFHFLFRGRISVNTQEENRSVEIVFGEFSLFLWRFRLLTIFSCLCICNKVCVSEFTVWHKLWFS